ncbi:MAG: helix-turn-helix domain protein [Segetibacter sp.]|nr:helix-turn-helix domain protein [Segetibacter sp.]
MNTKLNNIQVNPEFDDLFSFESKEDKTEHDARMISYRFLSEVEKICEEKNIKKKDLAEALGTSRSYITQLFRGNKQVNTYILAKLEDALDISFEINAKLNEDTKEDFLAKQLPVGFFNNKRYTANGCIMYCLKGSKQKDKTNEIVAMMKTENKYKQTAG